MRIIGVPPVAGIFGALAYLVEQELDMIVIDRRSNDLHLLGGLITANPAYWRPLGVVMHLAAGAIFGTVFDRAIAPRLRGPYWLRGLIAAQLENAVLWPLVAILDRVHPAVRSGALAPLNRPVYFLQAVLRHVALGVVLGWLVGRGRSA